MKIKKIKKFIKLSQKNNFQYTHIHAINNYNTIKNYIKLQTYNILSK